MKRLLLLTLAFASATQAGPHPISFMKHHPVIGKLLAASASGAVELYGVHHCQQGDIERCLGGYGNGKTIAAIGIGLNFALIPISEKIGGKAGALSYGGSAANIGIGIRNWRQYKAEKKPEDK